MSYSVIIPAYNAARTIKRAVESALAQTVTPGEIIVVDDGSSDETAEIVSAMPGITLVRQENRGPGAARNRGVAESGHEWLAFLDADDAWLPQKMERQLSMATDPGIGVIHCRGPKERWPAPALVAFDDLWVANCISLSSAIVRRAAFDQVGGFFVEEDITEDYHLWLYIAKVGWKIATWPETLIRYTPEPFSHSSNQARLARAGILNAELIGELFHLESEVVARKIHSIQVEAGLGLLWKRELDQSRRFFSAALKTRPSPLLLLLVMITFLPSSILDLRRRWSGGNGWVRRDSQPEL